MRLVDLLLLPRQQSYGVSSNDSHYRHPLGSAYLRSKNSEELKSNRKNLDFYRRQDSALGHQPAPDKSLRSSTGSLSDLLRSKKSPTSPGYWNHPTVNPSPSSATGETLRLAQLINDFVKQESDETGGFTTTGAAAARGCFDVCSDDRQPLPTMDKTLNGNIWNREEFSSSSSSSSYSTKFFPSLSSSSSSSASSLSSLALDDRASFNRRRISFLSSDGSELEPEPLLQSLATDSDGYESLSSSPLEAVDSAAAAAAAAGAAGAFRWMEEHAAADSAIGYLDWHGGGGGGEGEAERGGYDIETCPLFNFNFLENTLDDCPFESFDTKDTIPRYDNSSFCDSPMVSMVPDVMATEALKSCGSFSDRDDVQSSFRGHLFKLNELDRRTRHGLKSNDGSDLPDFPPSSSVTAVPGIPAAPVSSTETLQQSEVVKLLLQNRHQWAVPQEKVPSPPATGCRGSRKRASAATNGRDVGRAKVARETRSYNDVPNSNEEISLSFAPFVRTNSFSASGVDGQVDKCDHSSSLEKLITELMLFESSTQSDSEGDVARHSSSSETSAASAFPYVELFTPALHPSELFDGLAACRISDTELFSSLDLESVYLSDCEPFSSALGDGLDFENAKSFEAFVKTEPEKAPFLSLPPSPSLCPPPDSFGHPGNWSSGADSPSSRNDGRSSIVADHKTSVLERILQTNLLFDSLDCDAKLLVAGGRGGGGGFVSDHDYCQNLEVLSLNDGALDLTCDQNLRNERRRRTEISPGSCCYSRKRDYSALKSLLLDSNLTEEVRKEVELDRAKSRKKMSEKLKVTSVNDPARLQRLGKIRDDRILKQHLENYDPYCDVDRANSETTEGSCQQEKCASIDAQSGIATGRYSPAVEISRRDFDSGTAQPELPAEDSSGSGADDNNTLVTSDLELSGGDDAVFFNSFEDFYSKNQSEIELSHRQSNASNDDENDDPTKNQDSPTEFEPKVKRNRRKSAIGKRIRVHRSVGRSGSKVARSSMRRPRTGTSRPLLRTGAGRSVDHRRRKLSNSTPHLRDKSPPINNNRSSL